MDNIARTIWYQNYNRDPLFRDEPRELRTRQTHFRTPKNVVKRPVDFTFSSWLANPRRAVPDNAQG